MRFSVLSVALLLTATSAVRGDVPCSFEDGEPTDSVVPAAGTRGERVEVHATDGKMALKCLFPGNAKDTWPGLSIKLAKQDLRDIDLLAFDVWNPSDKQISLNWRVDDAQGKKQYGGISLKPGGMTTAEIYIKALSSSLDISAITQVYPYVRCPREDVTLYVDNFRFGTFEAKYRALTYRETEPHREIATDERERGFAVFQRHWMDTVFASSRPRPGETMERLQCFACPGEYEPLTFSLYAVRDLSSVSVTVSDLVSADGDAMPPSQVKIYPVRGLNKRVTYSSRDYVKDLPVLLERRASVDIPAETCKRFWLDIHTPEETPAGIHTGRVTVHVAGRSALTIPLRIRVLPYALPPTRGMIWGEYYRGPALAGAPEQAREFVTRDLKDMREHGMTSVGLCMGLPTAQATYADRTVSLNLGETSLYEHVMDTYRYLGFPEPIVQLSDSGQGFATQLGLKFGSDEYAQAYKAFWHAMQQECRARGWPEIIVQPVDEPGWKDEGARDRNVQLLRLLKQIPGMRTEQDGPGDGYFHGTAGPVSDIWNYNGAIASPEVVAEAQQAGHIIMLYNCDVESYRPEVQRYAAGFFQKRAGISGCYNWAYTSFSGSPYDDLDFKTGTWMHVYPAWEDEVGGPSTGWQGFREGIDDYRYIAALEGVITRLQAAGTAEALDQAKRSQDMLRALLDSISYSPRVRSTAKWTRQWTDGDKGYITGQLKAPTGWEFGAYDTARWQIADATLAGLALLGDIEVPAEGDSGTTPSRPAQRFVLQSWRHAEKPDPSRAKAESKSRLGIAQLDSPPVIDGELGREWSEAAHVTGFQLSQGGTPGADTEAWLGMTPEHLYVAFRCNEPYMDRLTAGITEDGGPVWKDDCVELFIDANHDRATWRQVVVNCLGKHMTTSSEGDWAPKIETAAARSDESWSVELRIPRSDLGLSGLTFGLNLCRERRPTEVMELIAWSPTGNRFARPDRFGVATLGTSVLKEARVGAPVLGLNRFTASVTNPLPKPVTLRAVLLTTLGSAPGTTSSGDPVELQPGQDATLRASYTVGSDSGVLALTCRIIDCSTGATLAEQPFSVELQPACGVTVSPTSSATDRGTLAAKIDLRVSPSFRETTDLYAALAGDPDGTQLGKQESLGPIQGDRALLDLNVGDLPPGTYSLTLGLEDRATAKTISSTTAVFIRFRGPFPHE